MNDHRIHRPRARRLLSYLLPGVLLMAESVAAQSAGAMLYTYRPHPGERASFDEGYRMHLEWHRTHGDSLPWYGWDVLAGRRKGQFVDGTFGIAFAALDRRVDPSGDAAHAALAFADHAEATGQWALRLRPELSTARPLEARRLWPLAQVVTYTVPPGDYAGFESVLRRVRSGAAEARLLPYTVYETVVGGSEAEFMLVVWRTGLAEFDAAGRDPAAAVRRALSGAVGAAVRAQSELWRLRRDLTLLPGGRDAAAAGGEAGAGRPLAGPAAGPGTRRRGS